MDALNSTSKFYYFKQIKFTDKKGKERFTSSGGRKQIFLVACTANVPENRQMVKLFFKEMKLKDLDLPYILLGDEKMKTLIFG